MTEIALPVAQEAVRPVTSCRACASEKLEIVLDLGVHAVSDFVESVSETELRAPLTLVECANCGLVQLTHSVDRNLLYKTYWYRSGLNPAMVASLRDVVEGALARTPLNDCDVVMDIGANDGTLLDQYNRARDGGGGKYIETVGFEPSQLWKGAAQKGHNVIEGYYPENRFKWTARGRARIITSIAMFYDLDRPGEFVKAIKEDLASDGAWVNQMMDLDAMLSANAFDNICHEHIAYWDNCAFTTFVEKYGLTLTQMIFNDVNGGSTRTTFRHGRAKDLIPFPYRGYMLRAFARRVKQLKESCVRFLQGAKDEGKLVLGYGASTKGNTLLQYYGITPGLLPAIAERNPDKVGRLTAGAHIPIISEDEMRARRPDYLLILPWHFLTSFLVREGELRERGTKFIVPLPVFKVV